MTGTQTPTNAPSKGLLLREAARIDWRSATRAGRLVLILSVAQLVYEWGAFNESAVSILAGWSLGGRMTVIGVALTGLLVGGVVFATQIWSGLLFMCAVGRLPRLFRVLQDIVQVKFATGVVPTYMSLSWFARIPISFLMGSSFVVTQDRIAGERRLMRSVLTSSAIAGLVTFCIVGVFGGAVVAARGTPMELPAEIAFAIVSDWRSWVVVIVGPVLVASIRKRIAKNHGVISEG